MFIADCHRRIERTLLNGICTSKTHKTKGFQAINTKNEKSLDVKVKASFFVVNLIAGRLLLSRACFLFRFTPINYNKFL